LKKEEVGVQFPYEITTKDGVLEEGVLRGVRRTSPRVEGWTEVTQKYLSKLFADSQKFSNVVVVLYVGTYDGNTRGKKQAESRGDT